MKKLLSILIAALLLMPIAAYAQKSFDMRYNEAVEYYTTKQYDLAITTLEAAKKSPGVTKDQISKANMLINQCNSAKRKLGDLNLSKEQVKFTGGSGKDSIYVTAGKAWTVTAQPEWIKTSTEADVLFIEAEANQSSEQRQGVVEVSMGKERTAYILVTQEKRSDVIRKVHIQSNPARSIVYIDQENGVLAENFYLPEGSHKIRLEKNGYEQKDTTIVVTAASTENDLDFTISLTPSFAMLQVNISPEEGYVFDAVPKMDISGRPVDLHPSLINSFNVDQNITYYELYEDNIIPLQPGQYVIRIESEGFKMVAESINIAKGEKMVLNVALPAINGMLTVQDAENAKGAKVFIDGKEVGEIPLYNVKVKAGNHKLKVEKPSFLPEKEEYAFTLNEEEMLTMNISMKRYSTYNLTSNPPYCQVIVDGEKAGTTPLKLVLIEGSHTIRMEKDGYFAHEEGVDTDLVKEEQDINFELPKTYPLLVSSDLEGCNITISNGKDVLVSDVKTPATVEIPTSKTPYRIKLTRSNDFSTAYKGWFWYTKGQKDHLKLNSYSIEGFQGLGVNYYLKRPAPYFGQTELGKDFQRIGDASLAKMRLFDGLTTSVVKATLFTETDPNQNIKYPGKEVSGGDYKNISMIPALTILFLNGEFRIGGGVHNLGDVNLLATYAWYPNVSSFIPMTHMSGHDIFLGAEISSRIPIFNANIRFGLQSFYGQANICRPTATATSSTGGNTKSRFGDPVAYVVPLSQAEFVVTIGFTLGTKDSKGNSILRVF
ncbi:MAG: PEGA domain-containing protein [Bacteroidales bacterium]|nr:PEGA domain-containing protein [Bacteroidales bacterium]